MSSSGHPARGLLFVVSAPSGTGKTTVVERLLQVVPGLTCSRSYTTRAMHAGEVDGRDYNFISRDEFERMMARGDFLEHAEVFGNFYGTGRAETERCMAGGNDVVLVIDVQGARQVRQHAAQSVGIFVLPPSFEVLERRLRGRSRDAEVAMRRRLDTARSEVSAVHEYDYVVVNDDLAHCVAAIAAIIQAERARLARQGAVIEPIISSFGANLLES